MQFINPGVLFALFAVLIPVIIHLFNFRKYRKVYFSNVSFLRELQQKTQKNSQLLHLLVLIMRILAIVFLVIAFAQPFIPEKNQTVPGQFSSVSIFVDNSFSMEASGVKGKLLEEAKTKAKEIASAYKADDLFQLLTNDFEGGHQRFVSRDEFLELLAKVRGSAAVKSLDEICSRQQDLLSSARSSTGIAYIISDFQNSTILEKVPEKNLSDRFELVRLAGNGTGNLYIDSCWFSNPVIQKNKNAVINVRVRNTSSESLEKIPLKLMINNRQSAIAAFSINAESSAEVSMPFPNPTAGIRQASVELSDYPITYDDIYYFTFSVSDRIPVHIINRDPQNEFLRSVFSLDSVITLSESRLGKTDYSAFSNYRLIVLNDIESLTSGATSELKKFVINGGSLLILPSMKADPASLNLLLSELGTDQIQKADSATSKVSSINTNHPLFSDVFEAGEMKRANIDLPVVYRHFSIKQVSKSTAETLIELSNGDPMLTVKNTGQGKIYLSAVPVDDKASNWPQHALFVPAMLNMAFNSGNALPLMYFTGTRSGISLGGLRPAQDNIFRIVSTDGKSGFIPEFRNVDGQSQIFLNDQLNEAGIYEVKSGDSTVSLLAFNYNRKESDLRTASEDELVRIAEKSASFGILESGPRPLNETIAARNSGTMLWKWFLISGLLSIIAEVLLLRFFGRRVNR